ncbi:MAG: hypothetical protein AAGJ08_02355 [Cyanobacteria bacterium P01_H01_bin.35]
MAEEKKNGKHFLGNAAQTAISGQLILGHATQTAIKMNESSIHLTATTFSHNSWKSLNCFFLLSLFKGNIVVNVVPP